ncbi:MAG: monooxygenase [Alphaproteobacteria bacterium]
MITALVQFKVTKGASRDEVVAHIRAAAGKFEGMPGLIRKNFLYDGARGIRGGVYTWESREAAEKVYAEGGPWRQAIRDLSGADPDITIFETPVIVDNEAGEIKTAA